MSHQEDQELANALLAQAKEMRTRAEARADELEARAQELEAEARKLREIASQLRAAMQPEVKKPYVNPLTPATYRREDSMDPDYW